MAKLTIVNLCRVLENDGIHPAIQEEPNTIEWVNSLLLIDDLYDRISTINNNRILSKRLGDLRRKFRTTKNELDLIRLNRVLIEEYYPNETPKMPRKAIGLSMKEALELRDQIEITLETGPRKEELLRLRCGDIKFETGMVRYFGKGGKTRFVPMNKRAREILLTRQYNRTNYAA